MEDKIRHILTCIAFQNHVDLDLIKRVKDVFEDYVKTNDSLNIKKMISEFNGKIIPNSEISFIRTHHMKFVCAVLLNIAVIFYKVPNHNADTIIKLLNMMIDEPTRIGIDEVLTELNHVRFSHEAAIYLENTIKILDMNNDEFVTANMEDYGFSSGI